MNFTYTFKISQHYSRASFFSLINYLPTNLVADGIDLSPLGMSYFLDDIKQLSLPPKPGKMPPKETVRINRWFINRLLNREMNEPGVFLLNELGFPQRVVTRNITMRFKPKPDTASDAKARETNKEQL